MRSMMALFRTRLVGPCLLAALSAGVAPMAAPVVRAEVSGDSERQEYWAKVETRDWAAAAESAETLVGAARTAGEPLALARALTMLGNAQLDHRDAVVKPGEPAADVGSDSPPRLRSRGQAAWIRTVRPRVGPLTRVRRRR